MNRLLPEKFEKFRQMILDQSDECMLLDYLADYCAGGRYTGAHFHELTFAGPSHPDRFNISDIASLSLLSVTLDATMAKELTEKDEDTRALKINLSQELDRDLSDLSVQNAEDLELRSNGLYRAWKQIGRIHGIGQTRTSKLLARKRPRLVPI